MVVVVYMNGPPRAICLLSECCIVLDVYPRGVEDWHGWECEGLRGWLAWM